MTITLKASTEHNSQQGIIPFAAADIYINILGTPIFEEYIQNINNHNFRLQFK